MSDFVIIISFVLFLMISCVIYNKVMMFLYHKNTKNQKRLNFDAFDINSLDISLVKDEVIEEDEKHIAEAIKRIEIKF